MRLTQFIICSCFLTTVSGGGRGWGGGVGVRRYCSRQRMLNKFGVGRPIYVTSDDPVQTEPLPGQTCLTPGSIKGIIAEFIELLKESEFKIGKYIMLSFHQCIGGCDGCLDLTSADNIGLNGTYIELRTMYEKWSSVLSLADYGILSGYAAYKHAVEADTDGCDGGQCNITLSFKTGRRTCTNPDSPQQRDFPHGQDEQSPITFVKDEFNLTDRETVALMGGHSVGESDPLVSGFEGEWDLTPTILDNGYFLAMVNTVNWQQSENKPIADAPQWDGVPPISSNELMMHHADMILLRNFTVDSTTNRASCPGQMAESFNVTACADNQMFAKYVREFSEDNVGFLNEIARAIVKMRVKADFDRSRHQEFIIKY